MVEAPAQRSPAVHSRAVAILSATTTCTARTGTRLASIALPPRANITGAPSWKMIVKMMTATTIAAVAAAETAASILWSTNQRHYRKNRRRTGARLCHPSQRRGRPERKTERARSADGPTVPMKLSIQHAPRRAMARRFHDGQRQPAAMLFICRTISPRPQAFAAAQS
jgi:hypothetical protein